MTVVDRPAPASVSEGKPDRAAFVSQLVLQQLGRPKNFCRIDAKSLWGNHFRVNIYCVVDSERLLPRLTMSDSFFVTLTEDAIEAMPPIAQKYADIHLAV